MEMLQYYNEICEIIYDTYSSKQKLNRKINELLSKYNITFDILDQYCHTLLHYAVFNRHVRVVKFLIKKGVDVNEETYLGDTAMHIATLIGDIKIVKLLVKAGAEIDDNDDYGYTALHIAVTRNDINIAKFLIENRANVNAQDYCNRTPLHFAISNNNTDMATLLISFNADTNIKARSEGTPLHYAKVKKNKDMIKLLTAASVGSSIINTTDDVALFTNHTGSCDSKKALYACFIATSPLCIASIISYCLGFKEVTIMLSILMAVVFLIPIVILYYTSHVSEQSHSPNRIEITEYSFNRTKLRNHSMAMSKRFEHSHDTGYNTAESIISTPISLFTSDLDPLEQIGPGTSNSNTRM